MDLSSSLQSSPPFSQSIYPLATTGVANQMNPITQTIQRGEVKEEVQEEEEKYESKGREGRGKGKLRRERSEEEEDDSDAIREDSYGFSEGQIILTSAGSDFFAPVSTPPAKVTKKKGRDKVNGKKEKQKSKVIVEEESKESPNQSKLLSATTTAPVGSPSQSADGSLSTAPSSVSSSTSTFLKTLMPSSDADATKPLLSADLATVQGSMPSISSAVPASSFAATPDKVTSSAPFLATASSSPSVPSVVTLSSSSSNVPTPPPVQDQPYVPREGRWLEPEFQNRIGSFPSKLLRCMLSCLLSSYVHGSHCSTSNRVSSSSSSHTGSSVNGSKSARGEPSSPVGSRDHSSNQHLLLDLSTLDPSERESVSNLAAWVRACSTLFGLTCDILICTPQTQPSHLYSCIPINNTMQGSPNSPSDQYRPGANGIGDGGTQQREREERGGGTGRSASPVGSGTGGGSAEKPKRTVIRRPSFIPNLDSAMLLQPSFVPSSLSFNFLLRLHHHGHYQFQFQLSSLLAFHSLPLRRPNSSCSWSFIFQHFHRL